MTNVVLDDWPPSQTTYKQLFLSSNGSLTESPESTEQSTLYQADTPSNQRGDDDESTEARFTYTFAKRALLLGYPSAQLFMSTADHDDMDVFVQLRKADATGKILTSLNATPEEFGFDDESAVPNLSILRYPGPTGIVRASRRQLDPRASKPNRPVLSMAGATGEPVTPGQVAQLDIAIWPTGIIFEAGEKLVFKVAGHPMNFVDFESLQGGYENANKGRHEIHFGGKKAASSVSIPLVEL